MTKAIIKTKSGLQVNVEGTPEEVSKIVSDIKKQEEHLAEIKEIKKSRGSNTATASIIKLRDSGFFKESRNLPDIKNKLAEEGLIYPRTTLSGVLIGLVKKGELSRTKVEKMWRYLKKEVKND